MKTITKFEEKVTIAGRVFARCLCQEQGSKLYGCYLSTNPIEYPDAYRMLKAIRDYYNKYEKALVTHVVSGPVYSYGVKSVAFGVEVPKPESKEKESGK